MDPGESVAGRVLVQRPRGGEYPQEITMLVQWNGEAYPLRFQVTKGDRKSAEPARPVVATTTPPEPVVQQAIPADVSSSAGLSEQESPPSVSTTDPAPVPESPRLVASPAPAPAAPPVVAAAPPQPKARKVSAREEDDEYNRRVWEEQARFGQ